MDHDLLWYDKKRYMGMPISFTRYSLSSDRLFLSTGFLTIRDEEILLYRVKDLNTKRTLWQRLFGVGTITVASSDKSMPLLDSPWGFWVSLVMMVLAGAIPLIIFKLTRSI